MGVGIVGKGQAMGRFFAAGIAVLVLAACADGGIPSEPPGADGGSDGAAGGPDALPAWCCMIDETVTCSCRQVGGTRSEAGVCLSICDAVPIVVSRFLDENGCPTIELSPRSCLDPMDAPAGQ